MIQASRSASLAILARHVARSVTVQPGFQNSLSRWIRGSPVLAASLRANVLLPAAEMPMTRTRCMAGIQVCGGRASYTHAPFNTDPARLVQREGKLLIAVEVPGMDAHRSLHASHQRRQRQGHDPTRERAGALQIAWPAWIVPLAPAGPLEGRVCVMRSGDRPERHRRMGEVPAAGIWVMRPTGPGAHGDGLVRPAAPP